MVTRIGGVAQLGEHLLCKQGVIGSIPIVSTMGVSTMGTRLEGAGRGARFGSNSIVEIKSSVCLAVRGESVSWRLAMPLRS